MKDYRITLTYYPDTRHELLSQDIKAADFEIAHSYAIVLSQLMATHFPMETHYKIEALQCN